METTADASEVQRNYTKALAEQLRGTLSTDTSITTLSIAMAGTAVTGLLVPGFVTGTDELKKAIKRLPLICNVVIVLGPHAGETSPFPVRTIGRTGLKGSYDYSGRPKGDAPPPGLVAQLAVVVRQHIELVLKQPR